MKLLKEKMQCNNNYITVSYSLYYYELCELYTILRNKATKEKLHNTYKFYVGIIIHFYFLNV